MELTLFGGFQLRDDAGNSVELSARKSKALLAWLAMHQDKNHARDRLAVLLWEESDEAQARHSLRRALSGLRKALGEHAVALETDQENVLLKSGPIQVDATQFAALTRGDRSSDALRESAALYGGEFLEGFNPRSNTYEEWLMTQRSHFREQAVNAMWELLTHYLETHQLESGVRLAIQLLSSDPLQERVYRALMQLYHRLNRPADALRQYRQCRRVLFRELGLAPEPETDRLYQEIAQSRSRASSEKPYTPGDSDRSSGSGNRTDTEAVPPPVTKQQLRPVTALHLHLGRFLEFVSEGDPETPQQSTDQLLEQIERLTERWGGQLHHQQNNAIVVLFGLPAAKGNECERAAQMALAVQNREETPNDAAWALGVQTGICSGSVLYDGERAISGAVFAQAEQIARSGQPGQTLIAESAYRGLRLPLTASGCDGGIWRLERCDETSSATRATPFIGRNRELRQFSAALTACCEDQVGETFLIRGEAGIGKSRLVEEIARQAHGSGIASHRALVLDFGMESQAEPIPALLRQLLDVSESATAERIEAQAESYLGSEWNDVLRRHALHALLRLPLAPGAAEEDLTEEALRVGSLQLLRHLLESAARVQPRLLVVEDIHWADQQTLTLVAELASIVSACAALLIITSCVEGEPLDPAWRSAMHGAPLTTLDLGPLPREHALTIAEELGSGGSKFIVSCVERSGGNPFFLEQLLWGATREHSSVPDSVQTLVITRLDMLPDTDKMAAQAASVLGQRFKSAALRHPLADKEYQADQLLTQRLIRPEGEGFLFGRALLRDGIYASPLPSHRRALHLRAAEWYRELDPILHAKHLDLANDEQAGNAHLRAVPFTVDSFDFEQALSLASRGAEIAKSAELTTQFNLMRGDLLVQSGAIDPAKQAYQAAAESATEESDRCRALIGLATGLTVQDQFEAALEKLDEAQPLAFQCGDNTLQTELYYRRGDILFALARVDECLIAHQQAEQLARQSEAPLLEIRALAGMADAYYACGKMKTAFQHLDRCIELAREERRLPQELGNLSMRGLTRFYTGSVAEALADELESAKLGAQYGNLRAEMFGYMDIALIKLFTDDLDGVEQSARQGYELAQQLGASRFYGDHLVAIGEALVLKGELDEGLEYIERAYRSSRETVPTHDCAFICGVLARVTPDEKRRQQAIEEGQKLLDVGSLSHNYLHYYQNLIEVCLNRQDVEDAFHYAAALENYTVAEPLAWSDFYIARGRLLATVMQQGAEETQRQEAGRLLEATRAAGLHFGTPELRALIEA